MRRRSALCPSCAQGSRADGGFRFAAFGRVDVVADREIELRLTARLGWRIRLRIDVDSPAEDGRLEDFAAVVTHATSTQPMPLGPYVIVSGSRAACAWRGRAGVPMLCRRLLEPGRYTLRVTSKAFAPIERVVDVAGGQVVDVVLRP